MKLYRTTDGPFVEEGGKYYRVAETNWDALVTHEDLEAYLRGVVRAGAATEAFGQARILAPIVSQEVWAAGGTYQRSVPPAAEDANCYDRAYLAERPQLFFKSTPHRVAGPGGTVRIRKDAACSIPECELTLLVNPKGKIIGYTAGNDMGSRDIEGENPLYQAQAKIYDGCCALGPCVLVQSTMPPAATEIGIEVERAGKTEFAGSTTLARLRRRLEQLVEYLMRDNSVPGGAFVMTGMGVALPAELALRNGDRVRVTIGEIGTLENDVVQD